MGTNNQQPTTTTTVPSMKSWTLITLACFIAVASSKSDEFLPEEELSLTSSVFNPSSASSDLAEVSNSFHKLSKASRLRKKLVKAKANRLNKKLGLNVSNQPATSPNFVKVSHRSKYKWRWGKATRKVRGKLYRRRIRYVKRGRKWYRTKRAYWRRDFRRRRSRGKKSYRDCRSCRACHRIRICKFVILKKGNKVVGRRRVCHARCYVGRRRLRFRTKSKHKKRL